MTIQCSEGHIPRAAVIRVKTGNDMIQGIEESAIPSTSEAGSLRAAKELMSGLA
jgi:hypothetical protein